MAQSWKMTELRVKLASVVPLSTPFLVIVDVANVCNFKCTFCFQSIAKSRLRSMGFKPAMMGMDLFRDTIDKIGEFPEQVKRLYLFAHGESLLNRNLPGMIRYAKSQNAARIIQITTNGSLLNPDTNMALLDAGLDELRVSLEGLSADSTVIWPG